MNKRVTVPVPQTLAEQKSDFTAEGAPPPGMVSTSAPVGSTDHRPLPTHSKRLRGTIKLKRPPADPQP
ncbi:MAG TPA: hypothetical protein VFH49_18055 [Aquabacterium sp.]|nr:hypothetical protein [Aquabacterium sp.]